MTRRLVMAGVTRKRKRRRRRRTPELTTVRLARERGHLTPSWCSESPPEGALLRLRVKPLYYCVKLYFRES